MAELFVQPKKPTRWWLWLLLVLIIAGVAYYIISRHNELPANSGAVTDSTRTVVDTTASR